VNRLSEKRQINPWNEVFKETGVTFVKPYKHFPNFLELLKSLGRKKKSIRILDLGCGTGRHTLALANLGYQVYGIDESPEGLKKTRDSLKKRNLNAVLCKGDVFRSLPYKDNFFNAVLAIAIIYHSTLYNIHTLIKEISRVLKKKGLFFCTSAISLRYSMSINSGSRYIEIEQGSYFPLDGREKWLPHHYFRKSELKEILLDNFKNVKIFNDRENYYVTSCFKK